MTDQPAYSENNIDDIEREHFIPITLKDLVSNLNSDLDLSANHNLLFRQFCKLYIALFHAKFFDRLQGLKDNYLPFSPDRVTLALIQYSADEIRDLQKKLIAEIQSIIQKANYVRLNEYELNSALSEISPYGLEVSVDFEDFDEIQLYYQGLSKRTEERRDWHTLYLKPKTIDVPIYRRLFLVLKLKQVNSKLKPTSFRLNPKQYLLEQWRHLFRFNIAKGGDSSFIYLKLFKDIPRSDLEMLFPNTRIEMQRLDKVTMGVSSGGGIIGGILAVGTKIVRAANPTTILFSVAGFVGIIWREVSKLISNRNRYMATLAKSLYFHNLDNNLGVLANLIEMAESEECKESILAYSFILKKGKKGCSRDELDQMVENYLRKSYGVQIDFELGDGIRKLQEAGLLEQTSGEILKVCSLEQAVDRLDRAWDEMFVFTEGFSEKQAADQT